VKNKYDCLKLHHVGYFIKLTGLFERKMMVGSGNGASVIKLIWAPFWSQIMLEA
jgi:hypothetical protein